jgi:hypothetical protein
MTVDEFRQQINTISSRYDARFANKPRATRNLSELDEITADLDALIAQGAAEFPGDSVLENARENRALYAKEREAIIAAKEQPFAVESATLATWANFVFDEYRRHYAGKSRSTRDTGRMEEMIAELDWLTDDMHALLAKHEIESVRNDLGAVESNLKLYETELENIKSARASGTRDDQVSQLANAANEQFAIYNTQFAGKGRTTRRPALLERMVNNLDDILDEMRTLNAKGTRNPTNTKNIGIVQNNIKLYQDELVAVRKAREEASKEDLAGMLGGAANDVMAEYRENFAGKDRATRDLDLISSLCDQMYEIALQMREIRDELPDLELNNRNLSIVLDNLIMYNTEYTRIKEAKGMS